MRNEEATRELFSNLVEENQDYLYSFVLGMLGNRDDAEDITARAFLKAYISFSSFKRECSFKTWVTTVAINLVKNYRRDKRSCSSVDDIEEQFGSEPVDETLTPEEITLRNENKNAISRALSKLPVKFRIFLVMRHLQGFSYEEIAELTRVPVTTVRNRIHQGKILLEDLFKKEGVKVPQEGGYELA